MDQDGVGPRPAGVDEAVAKDRGGADHEQSGARRALRHHRERGLHRVADQRPSLLAAVTGRPRRRGAIGEVAGEPPFGIGGEQTGAAAVVRRRRGGAGVDQVGAAGHLPGGGRAAQRFHEPRVGLRAGQLQRRRVHHQEVVESPQRQPRGVDVRPAQHRHEGDAGLEDAAALVGLPLHERLLVVEYVAGQHAHAVVGEELLQPGLPRYRQRAAAAEGGGGEDRVRVEKGQHRAAAHQVLIDLKERPLRERLLGRYDQQRAQIRRYLPVFEQQAAVAVVARQQLVQVRQIDHHRLTALGEVAPIGRRAEVRQVADLRLAAEQPLERAVDRSSDRLRIGDARALRRRFDQVERQRLAAGSQDDAGVGEAFRAVGGAQRQRRELQPQRVDRIERGRRRVDGAEVEPVEPGAVQLLHDPGHRGRQGLQAGTQRGDLAREVEPHRDVLLERQQRADAPGEAADRLRDPQLQAVGGGQRADRLHQVAVHQGEAGVDRPHHHLRAVDLLDLYRVDQIVARQPFGLLPFGAVADRMEGGVEELAAVHGVEIEQIAHRALDVVERRLQVGGEEGADRQRFAQTAHRRHALRRQGVDPALREVGLHEEGGGGDVDHHHRAQVEQRRDQPVGEPGDPPRRAGAVAGAGAGRHERRRSARPVPVRKTAMPDRK